MSALRNPRNKSFSSRDAHLLINKLQLATRITKSRFKDGIIFQLQVFWKAANNTHFVLSFIRWTINNSDGTLIYT